MRTTTKALALGACGLMVGGVMLAAAGSAGAAGAPYAGTPVGTLTLTPATGTNDTAINYVSSAACPSTATSFVTRLFGPGLPDDGEVVTTNTTAGFSTTGPISSSLQSTPQAYADKNATTLGGNYDLVLRCVSGLSTTSLGEFSARIVFSSATAYTSTPGTPAPTPTTPPTTAPPTTAPPTTTPPTTPPTTGTPVIRVAPASTTIKRGSRVTLLSRVVLSPSGTPVRNPRAVYFIRLAGQTKFTASKAVIGDASGLAQGVYTPPVSFQWFVIYTDTAGRQAARSAPALVAVRR